MAKKKTSVPFRDRIKELRRVPANELKANPRNWRRHPEGQLNALRGLMTEIGFAGAELARELPDGTLELIDGHARAELAGKQEVPVLVLDVNEKEAAKILATFDPIGAMAEQDDEMLRSLLNDVEADDAAVREMLDGLLPAAVIDESPGDGDVFEDEVPQLPSNPVSRKGDMWSLGGHRIACGDSRDRSVLQSLLGGELADMCFTDPPYNVAYIGKTKDSLVIQNDSMGGGDFLAFLLDVFGTVFHSIKPGSAVYVCHADSEGKRFRQAFEESGLLLKQCVIWVKNCLVLGRQDYQWRHEPILYGWKPVAAHRFYADRKQTTVIDEADGLSVAETEGGEHLLTLSTSGQTVVVRVPSYSVVYQGGGECETVWRVDKPSRSSEHPTMKPIRLCARAVEHGSRRGESVLDLFLGSGSTLIACEQLGRRCFGVELDEKYCDVILDRWSKLTGKNPVHESGQTWSDMKANGRR